MTIDEIKDSIIFSLTKELESDPDFNQEILCEKVDNAINEVIRARRYAQANYSQEKIESDIVNYLANIRNVSLYDYNQMGMDFQTNHSENGMNRSYMSRYRLFAGIIPLSRMV